MTAGTVLDLVGLMTRKAPEILDLVTATTDEEFERAFDVLLERAVRGLEKDAARFSELDENGLSSVLALAVSVPGLTVQREANSNGHVDLTIEVTYCSPARVKLGEAKIWDGPKYHVAGLEQLLKRYTTGREGRGLLIEYFKKDDVAGLVRNLRARMDADLPLEQCGATADYGAFKWWFLSRHRHSCGEDLEVGHVGCNLFQRSLPIARMIGE